ncbi:MAG TPA: twin-arginine translocase TatA/TatE family subunit [Pirellulaceae bacterium]|jgi:sec-independent protein translocase protein TatA|nr:twin-arginine translocase TatA/TatE family subunit [Pirellulaceae bacterium]
MESLSSAFFASQGFSVTGFLLPNHMELVIIAIVALLLFGHRLPSVMKSLGSSIKMFKSGMNEEDDEEVEEEVVVKKKTKVTPSSSVEEVEVERVGK